jgi:hypothetical protein
VELLTLPYIDSHSVAIAAEPDTVWTALIGMLDASFSRPGVGVISRILGSDNHAMSGPRPLALGTSMPGFEVVAATPGSELVLEGRHRFSTYALTFRIEASGPGQSSLTAESRATFPGWTGRLYRLAVIGSGGHVLAVKGILTSVRRRVAAAHPLSVA